MPESGGYNPCPAQGRSSIGREPVSKTGGCRFESCRPCWVSSGRGRPPVDPAPPARRNGEFGEGDALAGVRLFAVQAAKGRVRLQRVLGEGADRMQLLDESRVEVLARQGGVGEPDDRRERGAVPVQMRVDLVQLVAQGSCEPSRKAPQSPLALHRALVMRM